MRFVAGQEALPAAFLVPLPERSPVFSSYQILLSGSKVWSSGEASFSEPVYSSRQTTVRSPLSHVIPLGRML